MRTRASIALLLPLACLLGCTLPYTPSPLTGNWQIQSGTAITSPPTGLYFVGVLQVQGTQATGVFSTPSPPGTGTRVLSFTGGFNPTTGNIGLITNGFDIGFTEPAIPNTITTVGVTGGCVGSPPPACLAIFEVPSVGAQIAPLNGTYAGTLTDSASPSMSGTGTLTLTQSATPNASGQFPLIGTITFPSSTEFGTLPLSGTVSGEGITLYDPTPGIVPVVSLTASTNPAATQITVSNLAFAVTASDIVTFTGTLTRQ